MASTNVGSEGPRSSGMDGERVVISGMSGLFPQSHHVKDLSNLLYNKVNPVSSEGKHWKFNHPEVPQFAGSVPQLDRFDAQFFGVHFRLGNSMDTMSRKMMEQAYQAIYDAGLSPEHLSGKKIGVYVGTCFSETEKASFYVASSRTGFGIVGCCKAMFANRISYWLNAKGPSMAIDEACCSSTAALEQAYLAMSRGECEAAIVGGANLSLHPQSSVHYARILKLCMDGKTKSFDENADGCAKSEAINVLFLQKAKDALRIYADVLHVKSEFLSLEGDSGPRFGFYRDPLVLGNFLKNFYNEAGVPPEAVEYVEAFGSASPESDKAELEAISDVFCQNRKDPLLVGSVLSNIGYAEAASGISAVTKVLLGYHEGKIAANLHCTNPRKDVPALQDGRIQIVTDHQPCQRGYTAVNSISVTGCNAHVLLHGHYKPKDLSKYKTSIPYLVTISGRQETAVKLILDDLKSRPIDPEELALLHNIHEKNISGHLSRGFTILDTNAEQKTVSLAEAGEYFDNARRPLWFVYSGMGSQWAGMGAQLMRIPVFKAAIERCHRVLQPKGIDIVHIITSPDKTIFDNILHSFVGIAAVQIGLTDILRELGLVPDKIIGHSVGELGCAYADGCFTAEEMILSAYHRGLVSVQTSFIHGSMAAVGIGYQQIIRLVPSEIEVACHNSADSSTISGPADVMREFVATLTAKGIFAKEVPCSNIAYHSRYIADAGPGLLSYLSEVIKNPKPRSEKWLSTSVPHDKWSEPSAKYSSAEYHTNNLLNPVLFEETSRLIPSNAMLVEIAPHGLLQAILKRSLPATCKHVPLTRRGHPDNALLVLEAVGKLYLEGYNPKLDVLYPKVEFPVSTGTPFLSHLVQWAHNEKWDLPLYTSACRKIAAACKFIINLHEEEHKYLRGNVIRGKNVYPYAACLVAAWDTLAMTSGAEKKKLSVSFHDIHLFVQPLLNNRLALNLSVVLHRGTGRFEITDGNSKVATGLVVAHSDKFIENNKEDDKADEEKVLSSEDIYQIFYERDYSYKGEFQSLKAANKSLTKANIEWINNWVTIIDGIIQLNALKLEHNGISHPAQIRSLVIDVNEHLSNDIITVDNKPTMSVKVSDLYDRTRCGGIVLHSIKFNNEPQCKTKEMPLKTLKFIPRFMSSKIDTKTALQIFLQILAENANKNELNVLDVDCYSKDHTVIDELDNIPGLRVKYTHLTKEEVQKQDLKNTDLLLIRNLITDKKILQFFTNTLPPDAFIVIAEKTSDVQLIHVSSLYRVVSSYNTGDVRLSLARWKPAPIPTSTRTVTVLSNTDLALLLSKRESLSPDQKLLVVTTYPPIDGMKDLIVQWRLSRRNHVYLVMVNHKIANEQSAGQVPDLDLTVNVLEHGSWGGVYYVPLEKEMPGEIPRNISLQIGKFGDLNSLYWAEVPEPSTDELTVTVQYAALNSTDAKRATGVYVVRNGQSSNSYGMDFSGETESGVRVMGIVPNGACSRKVKALPELIWPVPQHWSMEEAATVPLPYAHALYCLAIKSQLIPNRSILVHGGAGALGQAAISIALGCGLRVFTTVSDTRKKYFLKKLFPELKGVIVNFNQGIKREVGSSASRDDNIVHISTLRSPTHDPVGLVPLSKGYEEDHIGNSRDLSFVDMVKRLTKGCGVDFVLNCLKGELKNGSIHCCAHLGVFLDTNQITSQELFSLGMNHLNRERNYITVDFASIFSDANVMKKLQLLMNEGISRGYVRPLSFVTYEPNDTDAARALRMLEASRHRGRVLLKLANALPCVQPRLTCSPNLCQLVLCDEEFSGFQLAARLIARGAKKLFLNMPRIPNSFFIKERYWQKQGVKAKVTTDNLSAVQNIHTLLKEANDMASVEGIYFVSTVNNKVNREVLSGLEVLSRKLCTSMKYFAVISTDKNFGNRTCIARREDQLPGTKLTLPLTKKTGTSVEGAINWTTVLNTLERAVRSCQPITYAISETGNHETLLQKIAGLTGMDISETTPITLTLNEIGVTQEKIPPIAVLLRDEYNISLTYEDIFALSVQSITEIDQIKNGIKYKEMKGLGVFYSYVDADELMASTEIVFLPTLTSSAGMRDDEVDMNQTNLCIVPGLEGHFERFRSVCEQIKIPALVLQPGLDLPNETIQDLAHRYAKILLKRTNLKKNFYLLGYEVGVLVAMEIASIFEDHGLTGTIYCIGAAWDQFQKLLENELGEFKSDELLQEAVIRHMFSLILGSPCELEFGDSTWEEKVGKCVRALAGRVPLSTQYARALFDSAYGRLAQARQYKPRPVQLRSKIVVLRANSASRPITESELLQQHSLQPIAVHDLDLPLAYSLKDLRCPAVINQYLHPDILQEFQSKNLCETYLVNADTFMQAQFLDDDSESR